MKYREINHGIDIRGAASSASRSNRSIPRLLENFDQLPDSAHVRLPVVLALVSISKSTAYRLVRSHKLPTPKKIGGVTAWNVGQLRQCLR